MVYCILDKQIHIYSVDTSAFYFDDELKIHKTLNRYYIYRSKLRKSIVKSNKQIKSNNKKNISNEKIEKELYKLKKSYTLTNKRVNFLKHELKNIFVRSNWMVKRTGVSRCLREESLIDKNIVSIFDSELTRTMGLATNNLHKDLIIVQTYFFDILENIVLNGFTYKNEKYIVYTASAGQIRTKKTVFIKEEAYLRHENTLTCGLTNAAINDRGTININKYLAYRALQNSATDRWESFDIDRCLVVDDFETNVNSVVDFIDDASFEIERKEMGVLIPHTDGAGMMLPSFCSKNRMCRMPWVKGLLIPFDFKRFALEHGKTKIKDIYGREYDIIQDDIQVIFTRSQFKMYKFYNSWDEYKDKYKKYNCNTGYCNEEENYIKNATINYQMLQTLTDISNKELKELCRKTKESIDMVSKDKNTMLKILGATPKNESKNYYQNALQYYPQLLNDSYSKEIIKQVRRSMVKKGKSGKLKISGKYTFICPDLYAFCEWLFLGIENPKGILKGDEVSCNIYDDGEKLDCLRSPHLYLEHCVRKNVLSEDQKKWFVTKGLYTSCHDVISKILQFDVDGDKSLVCNDKTLVKVAERNVDKFDIVPLYYHMKKAGSMKVDNKTIYKGMTDAYRGGNIGEISNNISKIWNDEVVDLDAVKFQCMLNNFVIDYAKTLYKPAQPKWVKEKLGIYSKKKLPNFFINAKDKTTDKVEVVNNSTVNKISKQIKNTSLNIEKVAGRFYYTKLMNDKGVELDQKIIEKYKELEIENIYDVIDYNSNYYEKNNLSYEFLKIRSELLTMHDSDKYVVDVLIKYLYMHRPTNKKLTLWSCFGDIILDNLTIDLTKKFKYEAIECAECGKLIEKKSKNTTYCPSCLIDIRKKTKRKSWHKNKSNYQN